MSAEQKDNRTATQRLDDIERVVASLYNGLQQIANGLDQVAKASESIPTLQQAVRLINKRLESLISVAKPESGITLDTVDAAMVAANVQELKEQVEVWVASGILSTAEALGDKTFAVCSEYDSEDKLVNPRIQFALETQGDEVRTALAGKKAGDRVQFGEGRLSLQVLEVYTVNEPKPAVQSVPAPEAAAEVPAPAAEAVAEVPAPAAEAVAEVPAPAPAPAPEAATEVPAPEAVVEVPAPAPAPEVAAEVPAEAAAEASAPQSYEEATSSPAQTA